MTRRASRPIRVFYSELSCRFYAMRAWRECTTQNGARYIQVTGEQFDVTDDIAGLIKKYDIVFTERAEAGT